MKPNFCVITTTYRRPESVLRAVSSVENQSYPNWQHIVVIDDPDSDYTKLRALPTKSSRLKIIDNQKNIGKNASVNSAFILLKKHSFDGYVILLDDDDWLAPNCLHDFAEVIIKTPYPWLVSNRTIANTGDSLIINTTQKDIISYQYNYLLKKDFSGDVTHCLYFPSIRNVPFPLSIKNAEEWLYFAHVSTIHPRFKYLPTTGTLSDGYASAGLTNLYRQNHEKRKNSFLLFKEIWHRKILSPLILVYVVLRLIRSVF